MFSTLGEIIDFIIDGLKASWRQLLVIILLVIFVLWGLPLLWALLVALIGSGWGALLVAALLILGIIALWRDGGVTVVTGPCSVRTYRYFPDICVPTGCLGPCTEKRGPYPSWMGKWALASQAVGCTCSGASSTALTGLLAAFQKAKDKVGEIDAKEKIRAAIIELLGTDLSTEDLAFLERILAKMGNNEQPTPEELDHLKKLLPQH
jgi:hypothetical protein